MDALIVYPETKEQLAALKTILKAMQVTFEQKSQGYPEQVIKSINESRAQANDGKLNPFSGVKDMLNMK
ncbi:DUF2683 family protein [Daejeonella sp.]|uniref:DUF2683 family protein n=1 Tax=Daejeonella sp. TaxID=2805397 RepID=UPI002715646D|nr:DUF2683 family protein [Daejeonella sp.]MDO8992624.1 hypothetical protein [Daejeonella sp.]MDP2413197.1 hypothetical protein [Daejeonella sp.]